MEHLWGLLLWVAVMKNTCSEKYVSMAQVFSYEFCKTFKNTYFEEYLWAIAFGCRLENHIEIEPQRFTTFNLYCLH